MLDELDNSAIPLPADAESVFGRAGKWSLVPVGSRVTCDPAPTDTDQDWLIYVNTALFGALHEKLKGNGWSRGGEDYAFGRGSASCWGAYRKEEHNIIMTRSKSFYRAFLAGTAVCKRLNVLSKSQRIAVFQDIFALCGPEGEE